MEWDFIIKLSYQLRRRILFLGHSYNYTQLQPKNSAQK